MKTHGNNQFNAANKIASYVDDTGTANAYVIALRPAITVYTTGLRILFKAANANTGASTLAVNGLTTKAIKKAVSTALGSGDILANQIIEVVYDGTNFQLVGGSPSSNFISSLGAIGSSPNANAATVSSSILNLEPASGSFGGVITTGTQTIAGSKTFSSSPAITSITVGQVHYAGTSGLMSGTDSFYWDNPNNQLILAGGSNTVAVLRITRDVPGTYPFITMAPSSGGGEMTFGDAGSSGFYPYLLMKPDGTTGNSSYIIGRATDTGTTDAVMILGAEDLAGTSALATKPTFDFVNYTTNQLRILANGNVGIANTAASSLLSIGKAGTKLGTFDIGGNTSGTISFVPQAAAGTYNWNWPTTEGNNGDILLSGGGGSTAMKWGDPVSLRNVSVVDYNAADVQNSGTSETDLHSYQVGNGLLFNTGETVYGSFNGTFNDTGATARLRIYLGGNSVWDTGALTVSSTGGWRANVEVMRVSNTVARVVVSAFTPSTSTTLWTTYTEVTGLTLTGSTILKVTGLAGGGSGGSSDITATMSKFFWSTKVDH